MNWQLALTGVIPAIIAMWYVDRLDTKRPEPPGLRRTVAGVGMLSVIPALILGVALNRVVGDTFGPRFTYNGALFTSYVQAAFIEELCKIGMVYWVVWRHPEFDERMDGIVYATRAGLGFAMVENFFYLLNEQGMGFVTTWLLRALLAVPGHAMWTGMIGAFAARRRFDGRGIGLLGGFLLAVFFHGTYDACIFLNAPLRLEGQYDVALALLGGPVVLTIAAALLMRRLSRTAAHLDDADALLREQQAGAGMGMAGYHGGYGAPQGMYGLAGHGPLHGAQPHAAHGQPQLSPYAQHHAQPQVPYPHPHAAHGQLSPYAQPQVPYPHPHAAHGQPQPSPFAPPYSPHGQPQPSPYAHPYSPQPHAAHGQPQPSPYAQHHAQPQSPYAQPPHAQPQPPYPQPHSPYAPPRSPHAQPPSPFPSPSPGPLPGHPAPYSQQPLPPAGPPLGLSAAPQLGPPIGSGPGHASSAQPETAWPRPGSPGPGGAPGSGT